jgi:hypothetical protein
MLHTFHIGHHEYHFDDKDFGLSDLIIDAAYIIVFLLLLGLVPMPYVGLLFQ